MVFFDFFAEFPISYNVACKTRLKISGLVCVLRKAPEVSVMIVQDV